MAKLLGILQYRSSYYLYPEVDEEWGIRYSWFLQGREPLEV